MHGGPFRQGSSSQFCVAQRFFSRQDRWIVRRFDSKCSLAPVVELPISWIRLDYRMEIAKFLCIPHESVEPGLKHGRK